MNRVPPTVSRMPARPRVGKFLQWLSALGATTSEVGGAEVAMGRNIRSRPGNAEGVHAEPRLQPPTRLARTHGNRLALYLLGEAGIRFR